MSTMLRQHVVVGCVDENIDAVDEIAQGVDMRLSDYAQAQARVQTVEARVTHATVYFDALHRVSLAVLERIIADPLRFFSVLFTVAVVILRWVKEGTELGVVECEVMLLSPRHRRPKSR